MRHLNAYSLLLFLGLLQSSPLLGLDDLTPGAPATVYFQWLSSPGATMTEADGNGTVSLSPYLGGSITQLISPPSQDLYLGVMCNRKTGYDVFITGSTPGPAANQCRLTLPGANNIVVTLTISEVSASFNAGATTTISEDLSGVTASASASFQNPSQTPISAASPNVWRITLDMPPIASVSDGLITAGSYNGSLTATVVLK